MDRGSDAAPVPCCYGASKSAVTSGIAPDPEPQPAQTARKAVKMAISVDLSATVVLPLGFV